MKKMLVNELKTGEKSGMISNFDKEKNLSVLHKKYLLNKSMDVEEKMNK
jgi:hypothetical protein